MPFTKQDMQNSINYGASGNTKLQPHPDQPQMTSLFPDPTPTPENTYAGTPDELPTQPTPLFNIPGGGDSGNSGGKPPGVMGKVGLLAALA